MNNINFLKDILATTLKADKYLTDGVALYKIKGLFDELLIEDNIDFTEIYGTHLEAFLSAKRIGNATNSIIAVRESIKKLITKIEDEQKAEAELEEAKNKNAIDSTCVNVTSNKKEDWELITTLQAYNVKYEEQLQLNDIPKKLGRPKSPNALSGAERAKRARDKKKKNEQVILSTALSKEASKSYNEMISKGYDLNKIIELAYVEHCK